MKSLTMPPILWLLDGCAAQAIALTALFQVGKPLKDHRLETLPAYGHLDELT
jgi:hypothetical protein